MPTKNGVWQIFVCKECGSSTYATKCYNGGCENGNLCNIKDCAGCEKKDECPAGQNKG